jgi:hypothetical protein
MSRGSPATDTGVVERRSWSASPTERSGASGAALRSVNVASQSAPVGLPGWDRCTLDGWATPEAIAARAIDPARRRRAVNRLSAQS